MSLNADAHQEVVEDMLRRDEPAGCAPRIDTSTSTIEKVGGDSVEEILHYQMASSASSASCPSDVQPSPVHETAAAAGAVLLESCRDPVEPMQVAKELEASPNESQLANMSADANALSARGISQDSRLPATLAQESDS